MADHAARMEEGRSAFNILMDKRTGKRLSGWRKGRWEDNIIMDLKEIGSNTRNWVGLTQNRDYWSALVKAILNFRVP